jgi:hypothetical protein
MRDCCCRGSDAGHAHVSCIAEYAIRKCSEDGNKYSCVKFTAPWAVCANCKQCYHPGVFQSAFASKFVEFVEEEYSKFDWRRLMAYKQRLLIATEIHTDKEFAELTRKSLEICNKLESNEFNIFGPFMYEAIGRAEILRGIRTYKRDKHLAKRGINRLKKARDLEAEGKKCESNLNSIEKGIASLTSECIEIWGDEFGQGKTEEESINRIRNYYEQSVCEVQSIMSGEIYYELSVCVARAIMTGEDYAKALIKANRRLEAWRLLIDLVPRGQQILGREHVTTVGLMRLLEEVKIPKILEGINMMHYLKFFFTRAISVLSTDQCNGQGCPAMITLSKFM